MPEAVRTTAALRLSGTITLAVGGLAADPLGRANYEFARDKRFILKEDRIFLKLASAPHAPRI